ncbi:hypothetical protein BDP55DRAFT_647405 [Colletotrichum godetiae]|uniref:Protein disulfide-isomerase n=1 Tax=Colletotrichum godetiae TaxID=1209918 RepID=A0AAJ0F3J7_9PEZI|nr:uncharacterized protein BDP55DRAFT_647405 [Colletotrichum godetiae]KAK1691557.1 hypothetical protein BDP55DRAFT_647405 [Colletotrichum godetiae]
MVFRWFLWTLLVPLVSGAAEQAQVPLSTEMRLIACAKSEDISKHLAAEWEAAQSSTDFPMAWIKDAADAHCADAPATAYPSVKLLRDGEPVDYLGPITSDEYVCLPPRSRVNTSTTRILRFTNRVRRPHVSRPSPEEAESFGNDDTFVCVARLGPGETALRQAFEAVARKHWTEFTFGVVDAPRTTDAARVVCRKRDDESTYTRTAADGLEGWVLDVSRPVIAELTPLNHQRFIDRAWPIVYIFSPSPQTRASIRADLHDFAKKQYASLTPVTVDPNRFPDLLAKLGLDVPAEDAFPVGAVHQVSNGRIYPYPKGKAFTPRELQGWGLDVWQGRVKPWTPPGQKEVVENEAGSVKSNVRVVGSHNLKVRNIPGLKIKIGGREREEL